MDRVRGAPNSLGEPSWPVGPLVKNSWVPRLKTGPRIPFPTSTTRSYRVCSSAVSVEIRVPPPVTGMSWKRPLN